VTVNEREWLADEFEEARPQLRAVAYRMLGSVSEAEDAVQEAWLRLSRSEAGEIENLRAWLTTVVGRVCLDALRTRRARREEPLGTWLPEPVVSMGEDADPEDEVLVAESVGLALLVVLETLGPAERLSFVLHDMFAVPFDEIGVILGRSPNAAKQLASRARRRLQGPAPVPHVDRTRQREVVDAFLAASRGGDFEALVAVLDPDIVLRADAAAVRMGASEEVRGAVAVAGVFSGRALEARPALVDGTVGVVWAPGGRPKVVWELTIANATINRIEMIADTASLGELDLVLLTD
jgi:RNA polymerase sigma-70 factor (ECF subfamily)